MDTLVFTFIIGAGATAIMDLWSFVRKKTLGIAPPDYGLVGRWIGHMALGRFCHDSISKSPAIHHETLLGWTAHYLIGVGFSALLISIFGDQWIQEPALGPAITVGICTVAVPFLLMQPGMGLGIAAAKTPNPVSARIQSLITHTVFGFGLYITALLTQLVR